jgi:HEPN domain-containing protein
MARYKEWLRFAHDDIETAEYLLDYKPRKLEIICYHSQQCAEKALKAILALHQKEIPRTHEFRILADGLKDFNYDLLSLSQPLANLQPYAVAVRYPYQLDLREGDEIQAIKSARSVLRFCSNIIENAES